MKIKVLIVILFLIAGTYSLYGSYEFKNIDKEVLAKTDSGEIKGIKYKFLEQDNYYSFLGEFVINIDYNCLFHISFDVDHKKKYNKNVSEIELIKNEKDRYVVKYLIEKLLFVKNTSYWMLIKHPEKKMITYEMLFNKSNMKLYDVVKSSRGYYKFIKTNIGYRVIYLQETYLEPGFLMKPYRSLAKDEAIKFMSDFRKYLLNNCK